MKWISFFVIFFLAVNGHAQFMQLQATCASIKVQQLKCLECQQRLDNFLVREKGPNTDAGIIQWKSDLHNGILKIQYFPDRIALDYIRTEIANAGFDADTVTAEPD